jgi:hypothetical protein
LPTSLTWNASAKKVRIRSVENRREVVHAAVRPRLHGIRVHLRGRHLEPVIPALDDDSPRVMLDACIHVARPPTQPLQAALGRLSCIAGSSLRLSSSRFSCTQTCAEYLATISPSPDRVDLGWDLPRGRRWWVLARKNRFFSQIQSCMSVLCCNHFR